MYLILETWGRLFSLHVNNKNTFELLTKDPFFWAQLPDFKIKLWELFWKKNEVNC